VVLSSLRTTRAHTTATLLLLALVWTRPCRSETPAASGAATREHAATAYDRGVSAYNAGDYSAAARAFLDADALVASDDALENALAAARNARDRALLEEAGTRAVKRESTPELTKLGREALAAANAMTNGGQGSVPDTSAAVPAVSTPPVAAATAPATTTPPERADAHGTRTWSPAVFYAGVGATAVLTGVMVWSGVDTLVAKAKLPGPPGANDRVMARAHRTDALLAATLVTAGATAYVGLRLVAWNSRTEVKASVSPQSVALTLRGAF
jgi:hypothetical protein